jgi:inosine-uridine nucleoside N-ribohydrolase
VTAAAATGAGTAAAKPKLLIDCDPGHDDALALLVAAAHADIVGITTVAGNAPLEATTRNACILRELAGIDAPVHSGAARALVEPPRTAPEVHGHSGLDGPVLADPARGPDGDDAVAFIVDTCRRTPGVWLVPTGPLTNIALALRRAPDLARNVAGISFMGGSAGAGNRTPVAEFNIWADPEAADVVLRSGVTPLRMAGLNLTRQFAVDDGFVARLAQAGPHHRRARFCADLLAFHLDRQEEVTGRRAGVVHDVCAVLAVTHSRLVNTQPRPVAVELAGRLTRGMTIVDERGYPGWEAHAQVEVGYGVDATSARALLEDAILGGVSGLGRTSGRGTTPGRGSPS